MKPLQGKEKEEEMLEKRSNSRSNELLKLERKSSTTPLESKLSIFCNENRLPETPIHKPTMFPVPKSQVLGKLKDFLGVMAESNKKLLSDAKNNPDKYDIEVFNGQESECIEMDLMLGVADLHTPEAVAAAESAIAGNHPSVNLAAESSSDSETENSSDEDDKEEDEAPPEKIETKRVEKDPSCKSSKKQNSKKRQKIVELC